MLAGRLMKILAKEHNLAVLTINQCVSFTDKPVRPALGQWWFSVPDLTILFSEQDAESVTKAKVIKSCRDLPNVMVYLSELLNFVNIIFRLFSLINSHLCHLKSRTVELHKILCLISLIFLSIELYGQKGPTLNLLLFKFVVNIIMYVNLCVF